MESTPEFAALKDSEVFRSDLDGCCRTIIRMTIDRKSLRTFSCEVKYSSATFTMVSVVLILLSN